MSGRPVTGYCPTPDRCRVNGYCDSTKYRCINRPSGGPQLTAEEAQGLLVDGFQTPDEVYKSARAKLSLIAQGEKP